MAHIEKIADFTVAEREVVEDAWTQYINTLNIIARLKGIKGQALQVADDRSGFVRVVEAE